MAHLRRDEEDDDVEAGDYNKLALRMLRRLYELGEFSAADLLAAGRIVLACVEQLDADRDHEDIWTDLDAEEEAELSLERRKAKRRRNG